jgi:hypothetical protein
MIFGLIVYTNMTEPKITPSKAIARGQVMVNLPVFFIMMAVMVLLWYLAVTDLIPFAFGPASFLIGPLVAWVFWSYMITKWRIWAYSRVSDIQELKNQAVDAGLIWKDGSFFERTEIRTAEQGQLINELEHQLETVLEEQEFVDDPTIPVKSEFKYSKGSVLVGLIQQFLMIAAGLYLVLATEKPMIGYFFIGLGIILSIKPFLKMSNDGPTLILSNEGITFDVRTHKWSRITNESAGMEGFGKSISSYLIFQTDKSSEKISLDEYDITLPDMRNLLKVYRGRHTTVNNL